MATLWCQVGSPTTPYLPPNEGNDCTPNNSIANCGQTASVSDMITIDSVHDTFANVLFNAPIADPLLPFNFQTGVLN